MADVNYLGYAQLMGQRNPTGEGLAMLGQTFDDNRKAALHQQQLDLQMQGMLRQNRLADMQIKQGEMSLAEAQRKQAERDQLRTGLAGLQPTPNPAFQAQQAAYTPEALNYDRMTPAARQFAQTEAGPGSDVIKGQRDLAIANAPDQPATKPADPLKMILDYAIRTGNYDEAKNAASIDDTMRKRAAEIAVYGDTASADKLTAEANRIEKQGTLIASLHKADPTGELTRQYIQTHADVFPGIDPSQIKVNNGFTQIKRDGYAVEVGPTGKFEIVKEPVDKETWSEPYETKVGGKLVQQQKSSTGQIRTTAQDTSTTVNLRTGPMTESQVESDKRAILAGQLSLGDISKRNGYDVKVRQAVLAERPDFNFVQSNANAKYATNSANLNTRALIQGVEPLYQKLLETGKTLGNTSIPGVNRVMNWAKEQSGNPDIVAFNNLRDDTIAESERVLLGSGVLSDSKYLRAVKNVNSAQSYPQLQAAVAQMKLAVTSRLEALDKKPYPGATSGSQPASGNRPPLTAIFGK